MNEHLSINKLQTLPKSVFRPAYDVKDVKVGIVHLGPGAFHRAHQAVYTDKILAGDLSWGICGVSLRSSSVRDKLTGQNNLYTLAILDKEPSYRIIGSIREILVAPQDPDAVLKRLVNPDVKIVTLTITEKGYCLTPAGELDQKHPDIIHDLTSPSLPNGAIGYLVEALSRRRADNVDPFVPISCDNLAENGSRLRKAVVAFASLIDSELAHWIEENVQFPATMVDSITPATDEAIVEKISTLLGVKDNWPIQREAFTQWVIEDFEGLRPSWELAGASFVKDVRPYEEAKLRILNGCHSSLAYLGSLVGLQTVEQAICDPKLRQYINRLISEEIIPSFIAPEGLDVGQYSQDILKRFGNPSIKYMLEQIAWDGSQKIPFRLLNTIRDNLLNGKSVHLLCLAVAAWMHFVRKVAAKNLDHNDPLKDELFSVAKLCTGSAGKDVAKFLLLSQIFPKDMVERPSFVSSLISAYASLGSASAGEIYTAISAE